jgi:hypothetical protein
MARALDAVPMLLQSMFVFVENTYFSQEWWSTLSDAERRHIAGLARTANAYYEAFAHTTDAFVPWRVLDANYHGLPSTDC